MAIVAAREKEGPEMEHGYAAYGSHPYKNITIHIGGITLKQSKEGVTEIYFSKLASPEYWKDSGEIHFKTSDTELTLTSDIALKGDIPEPEKTDDDQTVFRLNVGSFTLEVLDISISTLEANSFIIELKHNSLTEVNGLAMEPKHLKSCRYPNWIFFHSGGWYHDAWFIVVPNDEEIEFGNLQEGDCIPFPGSAGVTYKVTKVEHTEWGGIDVTVQKYENGTPTNESYTVHGYRSYDRFVPSIPPRVYC